MARSTGVVRGAMLSLSREVSRVADLQQVLLDEMSLMNSEAKQASVIADQPVDQPVNSDQDDGPQLNEVISVFALTLAPFLGVLVGGGLVQLVFGWDAAPVYHAFLCAAVGYIFYQRHGGRDPLSTPKAVPDTTPTRPGRADTLSSASPAIAERFNALRALLYDNDEQSASATQINILDSCLEFIAAAKQHSVPVGYPAEKVEHDAKGERNAETGLAGGDPSAASTSISASVKQELLAETATDDGHPKGDESLSEGLRDGYADENHGESKTNVQAVHPGGDPDPSVPEETDANGHDETAAAETAKIDGHPEGDASAVEASDMIGHGDEEDAASETVSDDGHPGGDVSVPEETNVSGREEEERDAADTVANHGHPGGDVSVPEETDASGHEEDENAAAEPLADDGHPGGDVSAPEETDASGHEEEERAAEEKRAAVSRMYSQVEKLSRSRHFAEVCSLLSDQLPAPQAEWDGRANREWGMAKMQQGLVMQTKAKRKTGPPVNKKQLVALITDARTALERAKNQNPKCPLSLLWYTMSNLMLAAETGGIQDKISAGQQFHSEVQDALEMLDQGLFDRPEDADEAQIVATEQKIRSFAHFLLATYYYEAANLPWALRMAAKAVVTLPTMQQAVEVLEVSFRESTEHDNKKEKAFKIARIYSKHIGDHTLAEKWKREAKRCVDPDPEENEWFNEKIESL